MKDFMTISFNFILDYENNTLQQIQQRFSIVIGYFQETAFQSCLDVNILIPVRNSEGLNRNKGEINYLFCTYDSFAQSIRLQFIFLEASYRCLRGYQIQCVQKLQIHLNFSVFECFIASASLRPISINFSSLKKPLELNFEQII